MAYIKTISGEIPSNILGFCQCHEHLMISKGVSYDINPALCIDVFEKTKEELLRYRAAGGQSIIDAQPIGCNRMECALEELAKETHVNILSSTGFHKLCFYPEDHWIHTYSEKELADIYIHEIKQGMFVGSDKYEPDNSCRFKASIIKTALDKEGLTDRYKRLFNAAVKAGSATNTPIMVHIEQGSDPLVLLEYLTAQGIPANKLIFCHLDRACNDLSIIKKIVSQGVYAEFDTIGRFKYHSDEYEIEIIKELLENGYGHRILCSLDTTRERLRAYNPDAIGLDYIIKAFIPLMRKSGIQDKHIHNFFYENCITALEN
jgi:phosphotriesterase-related protein